MSDQSFFPSDIPHLLTPGRGICVMNFLSQVELQILSISHPLASSALICEQLDASEHITLTIGRHQVAVPYCLYEVILSMREGERRLVPITISDKLGCEQVHTSILTQRTTHSYVPLHLVSFTRAPAFHEMTSEELLEEASAQKSIGNDFFLAQKRANAAYHYSMAAKLCVLANKQDASAQHLKRKCLLNLSACWLQFGEFQRAIEATQNILESEPSNEKALYRQAVARTGLRDWEAACSGLNRVLEINPSNQEALRELKSIRVKLKDIHKKEREKYSKLFS